MKTILNILDNRRPRFIWYISILLLLILSLSADLLANDCFLSPLLLIPVLIISWYGSNKSGLYLSVFTSVLLLTTHWIHNVFHGVSPSALVNALIILFTSFFIAIIVTNFRDVHRIEVVAADTDTLTAIHSSRSFYANLANEILRSQRNGHIFSLVYIDVDNFKKINDTLGHSAGDRLLIETATILQNSMRSTDTIARIGGDEFVCLMPETEEAQAKTAVLKAKKNLSTTMKKHHWRVSFSIGVVTFNQLPDDVREAVNLADELMYSVKNAQKNDIAYRVWQGPH